MKGNNSPSIRDAWPSQVIPVLITGRVTHAGRGDQEELIRCRYLIAAEGINSRVRRGLGLPVKEKDYRGSLFQNLNLHLRKFPDWTRFGAVLDVETLPRSEALSHRYGAHDERLFLVRPDGYLGFKARAGDAHLLHLYFEKTLGVDAH